MFYYVLETRNPETIEKCAHDIKVDRWDRLLFNHGLVGPAGGTVALCALIGVRWGLLAASLHAVIYGDASSQTRKVERATLPIRPTIRNNNDLTLSSGSCHTCDTAAPHVTWRAGGCEQLYRK